MTRLASLEATLQTATGGHVARVDIPPFETGYPPALVWGERFFLRVGGPEGSLYVETFCYHATVEVIDRDDPRWNDGRRNGIGPGGHHA